MTSATLARPFEKTFVPTTLANVLALGIVPPAGLIGLVYCWLARAAALRGDELQATRHLQSASAIARVVLFGVLALLIVGAVVIVTAFARR